MRTHTAMSAFHLSPEEATQACTVHTLLSCSPQPSAFVLLDFVGWGREWGSCFIIIDNTMVDVVLFLAL